MEQASNHDVGSQPSDPSGDRRVALHLATVLAAMGLLFAGGVTRYSDEQSMLELAGSILWDQDVTVPDLPLVGIPGRAGTTVSRYGIGQPLLTIPTLALGSLVSAGLEQPDALRDTIATSVVPIVGALTGGLLYRLSRRFGASRSAAVMATASATCGTFWIVYSTEYFSEPLIGLLLLLSVDRWAADRPASAVAAVAAAVVVHQRALPLAGALLLLVALRRGLIVAVRSSWPLAVAGITLLGYNVARFGTFGSSGYEDNAFSNPMLDGLQGLFLTSSKSFVLFAPVSMLGAVLLPWFARRREDVAFLVVGYVGITIVVTATWFSWEGGWSWGPRFLVPLVPLLALPLGPWLTERPARAGAVLAAAAVGLLVSLPALVVPTTAQIGRGQLGPEVVEQYRSVPEVLGAIDGPCPPGLPPEDRHCRPALWQVHVGRGVGPVGDFLVGGVTLALLVIAANSARAIGRETQAKALADGVTAGAP